MLETLVSSRIRRTLFEYLLTHSTDRFYLRGLAKQLSLSISPLRRELARLEQSGMLQAVEEGNMRFYTVNATSPAFLQLKQAGLAASVQTGTTAQAPRTELPSMAQAIPLEVISARSTSAAELESVNRQTPRTAAAAIPMSFRGPVLVGTALAGMALMLIMASLFSITMTNGRLMASMQRALTRPSSGVSVVDPHVGAASGTMRGARWHLVPGSFGGGFSTDSHRESY